jgi:hypothetical protein
MSKSTGLVAAVRAWFASSSGGDAPRDLGRGISYELLLEEREPIDGCTVCTVCLNLDRTTSVLRRGWRCSDCGVDTSNNSQRALRAYLAENSIETLEKNLREWTNVKKVRAAYKMLRSARYKCLLTLSRRMHSAPAAAPPGG